MKELFLWTVGFKVASASYWMDREIKVVTKTDSYGEAEKSAISIINEQQEGQNLQFQHITNIAPSESVYAEEVQK